MGIVVIFYARPSRLGWSKHDRRAVNRPKYYLKIQMPCRFIQDRINEIRKTYSVMKRWWRYMRLAEILYYTEDLSWKNKNTEYRMGMAV